MKTKIIHIVPSLSYSGGIENYVRNLCTCEIAARYEISIITFYNANDKRIIDELESRSIRVFPLRKTLFETIPFRYLRFIIKNLFTSYLPKIISLKVLLKMINPELIVAHGEDAELICGFIGDSIKKINVIHGDSYFPMNPYYRLILKKFSRNKFDTTIVVHKKLEAEFKGKRKVCFVKTGIDLLKFKNDSRSVGDELILGFIGRIEKEKGIYELLDAFTRLRNAKLGVILKIAGSGREKGKIEKLVEQSELSENVTILGEIKNTPDFYRSIDIFVLPSITEGFPLTILEAMASGVLVVANNVGGISDLIINGERGFLLENNLPETIFNSLNKIINEKEKIIRYTDSGMELIQKYDLEQFQNSFYSIIGNTLNE